MIAKVHIIIVRLVANRRAGDKRLRNLIWGDEEEELICNAQQIEWDHLYRIDCGSGNDRGEGDKEEETPSC